MSSTNPSNTPVVDLPEVGLPDAVGLPEPEVAGETCPQCHTTTPWKSSSWCPDCGYYPGVSDAIPESERGVADAMNLPAEEETGQPLMAPWLTRSIAIPTTIIVLSILVRVYFNYFGGERGLIALAMFVFGSLAAIVAHFRSSFAAINDNADMSPVSIFTEPMEMWQPTFRDLPESGGRIVSAASGLTAVFCALVVIGGIDFGALFAREKVDEDQKKGPGIIAMILKWASELAPEEEEQTPEGLIESLENMTDPGPMGEATDDWGGMPDPSKPLFCVVYGVMDDGTSRDFDRVLLASKVNGEKIHVGSIYAADLPKSLRDRISRSMDELATEAPVVKTQYSAKWLRPRIGIPIKFEGWTLLGEFIKPEIYSESMPTKRQSAPSLDISPLGNGDVDLNLDALRDSL